MFLLITWQKYLWSWLLQTYCSWIKISTINIVYFFLSQIIEKKTYICCFNSIRIRIYPSIRTTVSNVTHFLFQCLCMTHSLILTYSYFRNYSNVWYKKLSLQLFILGIHFCKYLHNLELFQHIFIKSWVKNIEILSPHYISPFIIKARNATQDWIIMSWYMLDAEVTSLSQAIFWNNKDQNSLEFLKDLIGPAFAISLFISMLPSSLNFITWLS